MKLVESNKVNATVFPIGVGRDASRQLLASLAKASGGVSEFALVSSSPEHRIEGLVSAIVLPFAHTPTGCTATSKSNGFGVYQSLRGMGVAGNR